MKVYGPYTRKDGRKHVVIVDKDRKTTVSYPKYLLQLKLGRELNDNETCDHIDGDKTNDDPSNLQVLTLVDNAKKQFVDNPQLKAKTEEFICPCCGVKSVKFSRDIKGNKIKGRAGPYCSRQCAGKHSYKRRLRCLVNSGNT